MSIVRYLLSVVLLVTLTDAVNYRLPKNVLPTHYVIRLAPNIEVGQFYGESNINITITTNDTRSITLHARNLEIVETFTTLVNANNNKVKPTNHTIDNVTDFLTLNFTKTPLAAGQYVLNLQYTGHLENEPKGFYRTSYINEKGETTWLAATQFAPTHARQAFPCFDEPAMKAKFEISFEHLYNYRVISNMPVLSTVEQDKYPNVFRTSFKVTPVMSTYVIGFVISNLTKTTSEDGRFSVWTRMSQADKTNYALNIGQSELELLEDYTVFENTIPKMDNVAIPKSQIGAKDNWGLVTYRENELLYEENVTTTSNKQNIAMTIAGEFARQWFGNLVSPSWWDFSWLNEGFANYFQYHITDEAETDWRMIHQFVVTNLQEKAFGADDTGIQRALNSRVESPEEISSNFDSISSHKAACIIRMFSHALGPKVFRTAMKAYIKKQAYGVAGPSDLVEALAGAKGAPVEVRNSMNSWINQKGYPLLTVIRHVNGDWKITQARYLPKKTNAPAPSEVWYIPLSWSIQDSQNWVTTARWWFSSSLSNWIGREPNKWIIVNNQQMGYYRVNYDATNWNLIINYLNTNDYVKIHALNRAQLLDDSFHLANSGYLSNHRYFLDITRHLQHEVDYVPWYPAFRAFSYLDTALMSTEHYELFKLYILRLIGQMETSVGYSEMANDAHLTKLNRIKVLEWACKMGSENCTTAVHNKLLQHVNGVNKISTDLRSVTLCAGLRMANAQVWEETFRYYRTTPDENERQEVLEALGCSSDKKILKLYLTRALNVQLEMSFEFAVKNIVDKSNNGVDVAIDFFRKNFARIIETVGGKETVVRCANYIGSRIFVEDQMEKMERFINSLIAEHKDLADALTANALARVLENIEWSEKHVATIANFLQSQGLTASI